MRRVFVAPAILLLISARTGSSQAVVEGRTGPAVETNATVPTPPTAFVAIQPCRLADTRGNGFTGAFGPPSLIATTPRVIPIAGHCGIPNTAQAVSANMAVTNTTGLGYLSVWPEGAVQPSPMVASLNYSQGQTIANAVIAPLGTNGGITVYAKVGIDLIIDVNGYYGKGLGVTMLVDSLGKTIGPFSMDGNDPIVTVKTATGFAVAIPATSAGFRELTGSEFNFWYVLEDCAGDAYLDTYAPSGDLGTRIAGTLARQAYWGVGFETPEFFSRRIWLPGEDPAQDTGTCVPQHWQSGTWGRKQSLDLRQFVPPFHIE